MRVTIGELELLCNKINEEAKQNTVAFENNQWNVGTYYISRAYGGNKLLRVDNTSGGSEEVTYGYVSKRELRDRMLVILEGMKHCKV